MSLIDLRYNLEQSKGERNKIENDLSDYEDKLNNIKEELIEWEKAQLVLQTVVKQMQETLRYKIEEVCSLSLETIFDDPYKLNIDFELRRGKTEADIWFERNGIKFGSPLDETGGGSCDIGALGLIFSMWSLRIPRTRALILLDQPFRNLDRYEELRRAKRASQLIKEMTRDDRLGLQIIIVTHNTDLITAADKVIDLGELKKENS